MKRKILAISLVGLLSFTGIQDNKKQKVELTLAEWQNIFKNIDNVKIGLVNSTLPTNWVLPQIDSLNAIEKTLSIQINSQLAGDSSTNPVKPDLKNPRPIKMENNHNY